MSVRWHDAHLHFSGFSETAQLIGQGAGARLGCSVFSAATNLDRGTARSANKSALVCAQLSSMTLESRERPAVLAACREELKAFVEITCARNVNVSFLWKSYVTLPVRPTRRMRNKSEKDIFAAFSVIG